MQPTTFGATDRHPPLHLRSYVVGVRQQLTHEHLVTLISEIAAVVNARSITALQSDTAEPLSGSHLGGSHLQKMSEDGFRLDGFRLEVRLYPTVRL